MRYSFLTLLLFIVLASACRAPQATAVPVQATVVRLQPTAPPAPTTEPIPPTTAPEPTAAPAQPTTMPGDAAGPDPFAVAVGQYYLATTGFDEMAAVLRDTQKIDLSSRTRVARVNKVLAQMPFPPDITEQGHAFNESLQAFFIAMRDNDAPAAIARAAEVAAAQQALSAGLDTWLETNPPRAETADPFNVLLTQSIFDGAGIDGMAAVLSDTQKIDPTFHDTVTRVDRVLQQATFPYESRPQADSLLASLDKLANALRDENVPAAISASETVQVTHQELSQALDVWLETNPEKASEPSPFQISIAQYYLDSAGFHDMAEQLAQDEKIEPEYLATVTRVADLLHQVTWAPDVAEPAQTFLQALDAFAAALQDGQLQEAITVSETVHDAQHALSQAIDKWLGGEAVDH